MSEPAAKPRGSGVEKSVKDNDRKIFRDPEMKRFFGEEKEPIKIKSRRKGVQRFEGENPDFEILRRHG